MRVGAPQPSSSPAPSFIVPAVVLPNIHTLGGAVAAQSTCLQAWRLVSGLESTAASWAWPGRLAAPGLTPHRLAAGASHRLPAAAARLKRVSRRESPPGACSSCRCAFQSGGKGRPAGRMPQEWALVPAASAHCRAEGEAGTVEQCAAWRRQLPALPGNTLEQVSRLRRHCGGQRAPTS